MVRIKDGICLFLLLSVSRAITKANIIKQLLLSTRSSDLGVYRVSDFPSVEKFGRNKRGMLE